jgi:hypothetical protein
LRYDDQENIKHRTQAFAGLVDGQRRRISKTQRCEKDGDLWDLGCVVWMGIQAQRDGSGSPVDQQHRPRREPDGVKWRGPIAAKSEEEEGRMSSRPSEIRETNAGQRRNEGGRDLGPEA